MPEDTNVKTTSDTNTIVIDQLTPEQEAAIPEYRDKWMKIGLNTDRIDREKIPELINNLYKECGFEAPEYIMYANNPHEACLQVAVIEAVDDKDVDEIRERYSIK